MCGRCDRSRMYGTVRNDGRTYPDGEPRREYRCRARQDWPEALRGCGRNSIDARVAEEAVNVAMVARLSDPRRAERVAAHVAQVRAQRSQLSGEIARLEANADDLAEKVAEWGTARVDKAMAPVLARIKKLEAELAELDDDPASDPGGDRSGRDCVGRRGDRQRHSNPTGHDQTSVSETHAGPAAILQRPRVGAFPVGRPDNLERQSVGRCPVPRTYRAAPGDHRRVGEQRCKHRRWN